MLVLKVIRDFSLRALRLCEIDFDVLGRTLTNQQSSFMLNLYSPEIWVDVVTFSQLLYGFGIGWFRGWIAVVGVGLVLTGMFTGKFDVRSLFYTAEMELTYAEDLSDVDCIKPRFCFVHYRFDIANTGASLRNEVTIIFHHMPREALWGRRVLPLTTKSTHTADAEIFREIQDDEVVIIIDDFQPGTLVKLEFIDKRMPRESGELLQRGVVEVIADGRHIRANPQATAFGRFIGAVF